MSKINAVLNIAVLGLFVLISGATLLKTHNELLTSSNAADTALLQIGEAHAALEEGIPELVKALKDEVGLEHSSKGKLEPGLAIEYARVLTQPGVRYKLTPDLLLDAPSLIDYKVRQAMIHGLAKRLIATSERIPGGAVQDRRLRLQVLEDRVYYAILDYNTAVKRHNAFAQGFIARSFFGRAEKFHPRKFYEVGK